MVLHVKSAGPHTLCCTGADPADNRTRWMSATRQGNIQSRKECLAAHALLGGVNMLQPRQPPVLVVFDSFVH